MRKPALSVQAFGRGGLNKRETRMSSSHRLSLFASEFQNPKPKDVRCKFRSPLPPPVRDGLQRQQKITNEEKRDTRALRVDNSCNQPSLTRYDFAYAHNNALYL